jgi:hypothetical protein
MSSRFKFALAAVSACSLFVGGPAVAQTFALESTSGLRLHNVQAEPVTRDGKRGLRVTVSADAKQKLQDLPIDQQSRLETLVLIEGTDFKNGDIEAEISGAPAPDAPEGARGFVGIAFRVGSDLETYDAFYLRPTNGRADDQVRRNHSVQYVSHPAWPWNRLRKEFPERYESYVDLEPGAWTRIRIEVRGERARLFVHGQPQPTLIVNDLKTGVDGKGAVALWINPGTIAHFRALRVSELRQ